MDSITIPFLNRSVTWDQIRLALFGLAAAIFLLQFFQNDMPKVNMYLDLRQQIEANQKELSDAQALTQTEDQVRSRLARVQANLTALRERFPPRNQILSILLVDLSKIFSDSHIQLVSFQPKDFTALSQTSLRDLGKISIDITARGSYPSVILLFDQLSRYERVLTIESPQLSPTGEGTLGNELSVTFTLTTYALNE